VVKFEISAVKQSVQYCLSGHQLPEASARSEPACSYDGPASDRRSHRSRTEMALRSRVQGCACPVVKGEEVSKALIYTLFSTVRAQIYPDSTDRVRAFATVR